jgi:hypothetical protein
MIAPQWFAAIVHRTDASVHPYDCQLAGNVVREIIA